MFFQNKKQETTVIVTMAFNIIVLACGAMGITASFTLVYGLYKDKRAFLIPWIMTVVAAIVIDLAHSLYLFVLETVSGVLIKQIIIVTVETCFFFREQYSYNETKLMLLVRRLELTIERQCSDGGKRRNKTLRAGERVRYGLSAILVNQREKTQIVLKRIDFSGQGLLVVVFRSKPSHDGRGSQRFASRVRSNFIVEMHDDAVCS
ncbi:hypothetical protein AAG570_011799 [Ranatra chinensis]|uniref:Uncharacterized protein n=1 Tax=Ranatra chinensis TaxID=642074 RepID=A0ABD0Z393_9HEMI